VPDHWYPADILKRTRVDQYLDWYFAPLHISYLLRVNPLTIYHDDRHHFGNRQAMAGYFFMTVLAPQVTTLPHLESIIGVCTSYCVRWLWCYYFGLDYLLVHLQI
jgi:hypothetical protein